MSERKPEVLRMWDISRHDSPQREIRALLIFPGKIKTLDDVKQIAHSLGKEVFHTKESVNVFPFIVPFPFVEGSYLVVVERVLYNQPGVGIGRGEYNDKGTNDIRRVSRSIDIGPDPSHSNHLQPLIPAA